MCVNPRVNAAKEARKEIWEMLDLRGNQVINSKKLSRMQVPILLVQFKVGTNVLSKKKYCPTLECV